MAVAVAGVGLATSRPAAGAAVEADGVEASAVLEEQLAAIDDGDEPRVSPSRSDIAIACSMSCGAGVGCGPDRLAGEHVEEPRPRGRPWPVEIRRAIGSPPSHRPGVGGASARAWTGVSSSVASASARTTSLPRTTPMACGVLLSRSSALGLAFFVVARQVVRQRRAEKTAGRSASTVGCRSSRRSPFLPPRRTRRARVYSSIRRRPGLLGGVGDEVFARRRG